MRIGDKSYITFAGVPCKLASTSQRKSGRDNCLEEGSSDVGENRISLGELLGDGQSYRDGGSA